MFLSKLSRHKLPYCIKWSFQLAFWASHSVWGSYISHSLMIIKPWMNVMLIISFLCVSEIQVVAVSATSRDCRWALCARLWKDPPVWADGTELRGSEWSGWYKYFSLCTLRRCSQQGVHKAPEETLTPNAAASPRPGETPHV